VSVLGKHPSSRRGTDKLSLPFGILVLLLALSHLVSPLAHPVCWVKGQPRGAAVPVGKAVPAVVEGGAVVRSREGPVQPGAVGSRDGRLQFSSVAAVDVVGVLAVLGGEGGVGVVESKPVAAHFLFGDAFKALPVPVAAVQVRVVALELVGALEVIDQLSQAGSQDSG